jgi:hypothetical protein
MYRYFLDHALVLFFAPSKKRTTCVRCHFKASDEKNLSVRLSGLLAASFRSFSSSSLKTQNSPQGYFVASLGRARSNSCVFFTRRREKSAAAQSTE